MSLKTYTGNCHCGQFRYQFKHSNITTASQCNCSYCSKAGPVYITPEDFEILRGKLKEYRFGTKSIPFQFCETCGTLVTIQVEGRVALNARTVTDLDIWELDTQWQDWNNKRNAYQPPSPVKHQLNAEEGEKVYTGSCHCGDVQIAVRTKPLPEVVVKECNCSICIRKALIFFYPHVSPDIKPEVEIAGEQNLTTYSWGRKFSGHRFCKTCAVELDAVMYGPPKQIVEKLSGPRSEKYKEFMSLRPVNLRALDDVEWAGQVGEYLEKEGKVKITREYDPKEENPYVLDP